VNTIKKLSVVTLSLAATLPLSAVALAAPVGTAAPAGTATKPSQVQKPAVTRKAKVPAAMLKKTTPLLPKAKTSKSVVAPKLAAKLPIMSNPIKRL